jgi:formylmethanofuran dehydrogenase subunit E
MKSDQFKINEKILYGLVKEIATEIQEIIAPIGSNETCDSCEDTFHMQDIDYNGRFLCRDCK